MKKTPALTEFVQKSVNAGVFFYDLLSFVLQNKFINRRLHADAKEVSHLNIEWLLARSTMQLDGGMMTTPL